MHARPSTDMDSHVTCIELHAAARLPNCQPHIYIRHMIVCIQLHVCIQLSGYVHMVSLISGLECGME